MEVDMEIKIVLLNFKTILLIYIVFTTISMNVAADENRPYFKVIYAFWPYWTDPSLYQPDWNVLTHVAYHSWDVNDDGTFNSPRDISRYNIVKNLSHQKGVKIIISIKSFDKDTMDSIFAYHKDDFADNVLDTLQIYGADGVNLDFEFPRNINIYTNTSNYDLFEEFMKVLYTKVKSKNSGYYISLNVAGSIEEVYRNIALSEYIDTVFLRGYNYHSLNSSTTGAPSPYNDVVNSVNILKKYYPSNKIVLGLYFSGYDWPSSSSIKGTNTVGKGMAISMKNAINNAKIYGRVWDSNSKTPWYRYQYKGIWHQVWYDDDQSLGLKLDYANSENILGVGFWALGYDDNNTIIWNSIKEKFAVSARANNVSTKESNNISAKEAMKESKNIPTKETPKVSGFELIISLTTLLILAFLTKVNSKDVK